jgi:hypothetical protein
MAIDQLETLTAASRFGLLPSLISRSFGRLFFPWFVGEFLQFIGTRCDMGIRLLRGQFAD